MGMTVGKLKEYLNNFDDRETVYYFDSEYGEDIPFSVHYITISDNFKEKEESVNNSADIAAVNLMRKMIGNPKMTIEQIIKYLNAPICGSTVMGKEKQKEYDAHDLAVIILRKYQKIEQIIKDIPYGGDATVRRIQEVIEDGNY